MAKDAKAAKAVNGSVTRSIGERLSDRPLIEGALSRAAREAVLDHARAGNPVATLRDDKVVWLQPEEVFALLAEMDKKNGSLAKP